VPSNWAATEDEPGVHYLKEISVAQARRVSKYIESARNPGDIVVLSIHWGGNWGYDIPDSHRAFAHRLIDELAVDVIHGHSSHHVKGFEVYNGRLILYGCGYFLTDYDR
ncbi:MAG: CapA family protein, partial [bacterium]